jgi:hypothetical protein
MKAIRNVLVVVALCAFAPAQSHSNPAAEQRNFNLEDAVQKRVDLSDAELAALAQDDLMSQEMKNDPPIVTLTNEGLAATVVHLCGSAERDLVVVGDGAPFIGANVGPFWIIRDLPAGPAVVLSEITLGLTIQSSRSNRCLNVEAFAATAVEGTTTDFRFNGQKYVVYKQKTAKLGQ